MCHESGIAINGHTEVDWASMCREECEKSNKRNMQALEERIEVVSEPQVEDNLQDPVTLPQEKKVNKEGNYENVASGLTTAGSQELLMNKYVYSQENRYFKNKDEQGNNNSQESPDKQSAVQAAPEQCPG